DFGRFTGKPGCALPHKAATSPTLHRHAESDLDLDGKAWFRTQICQEFSETGQAAMSVEEAALGFVRVANESMCRPIRARLACFRRSGGQHACGNRRSLGMTLGVCAQVLRHPQRLRPRAGRCGARSSGALRLEYRQGNNLASIEKRFQHLEGECLAKLTQQGFDKCASDATRCFYSDSGTLRVRLCGPESDNKNALKIDFLCDDFLATFGSIWVVKRKFCGGNDNNFEALFSQREELFNWLDKQANNNSGESSSRKVASKETSRREVENWYYMHFRFRMQGYQSLIYAIRQSAREDSVFSEDHLTNRIGGLRIPPWPGVRPGCNLLASMVSMVTHCRSGAQSKRGAKPRCRLQLARAGPLALGNGSCLFVSRASRNERDNANMQVQLDLLRGFVVDDGDELGYEHDDEGIFGRVFATLESPKVVAAARRRV
uniref:Decapping nuclease n=1 Tax=Macrostomum lignano TaxID=282301 RepID=A0A1I8IZ64_9PLAT